VIIDFCQRFEVLLAQNQKLFSKGITAYQYAVLRFLFGLLMGLYFLIFFLLELKNFHFSHLLYLLIAVSSLLLALGFSRKLYSALCLTGSCFLIAINPAQFLNLDIAAFIWIWSVWMLVPTGEPLSRKKLDLDWGMPRHLILFSWILLVYFLGLSLVDLLGKVPKGGLQEGTTLGLLLLFLFVFDRRWIKAKKPAAQVVIYFDGVCNLCNGFIDSLIQEDQNQFFKFAALQGASAKNVFPDINSESLKTVIVQVGDTRLQKAEAVLFILGALGGFWRIFTIFRIIPVRILNFVYDQIAKNRYRVFGKQSSCRLPSPQERALFLD
jgi:predicted DCC family thiol-disulfide oxidoreductase YuxK